MLQMVQVPGFKQLIRQRIRPDECYNYWDYMFPGFRRPFRNLTAEDVTPRIRKKITEGFNQSFSQKNKTPLVKITGWSRVGFLKEIFPEAKFIHIVRDARAVVNSFLSVPWWWGWRGPENWRFGTLSDREKIVWDKYHQSFIALASIGWNKMINPIQQDLAGLDEADFLEISYEALCDQTVEIFQQVTSFMDIPYNTEFDKVIQQYSIKNSNSKYFKDLDQNQIACIEDICKEYMMHYGYLNE
jgi:hypothetical protein